MQPLPLRARVFVAIVAVAAVPLPVVAFVQGRGQFALSAFIGLGILIVLTDSIGARGSRDLMTIALSSVVPTRP